MVFLQANLILTKNALFVKGILSLKKETGEKDHNGRPQMENYILGFSLVTVYISPLHRYSATVQKQVAEKSEVNFIFIYIIYIYINIRVFLGCG